MVGFITHATKAIFQVSQLNNATTIVCMTDNYSCDSRSDKLRDHSSYCYLCLVVIAFQVASPRAYSNEDMFLVFMACLLASPWTYSSY